MVNRPGGQAGWASGQPGGNGLVARCTLPSVVLPSHRPPPTPPPPPPALTRQLLHHLIKQPSEQVLKQCNLKAHPRVCDAPLALLPCLLGGRLATGALLVVVVLGGEGGGGGARLLSHQ